MFNFCVDWGPLITYKGTTFSKLIGRLWQARTQKWNLFKGHTDFTDWHRFYAQPLRQGRRKYLCNLWNLCDKICEPLLWEIDTIVLNDELHGFAAKFPGIRRDTQLCKFFTMGRQIPGESPRRHAGQPGQFWFIHCLHFWQNIFIRLDRITY